MRARTLDAHPNREIGEPHGFPSGNVVPHMAQIGTKLVHGFSRRRKRPAFRLACDAPVIVEIDLTDRVLDTPIAFDEDRQ